MFRSLDISTSGLVAQRVRMDVIAGNMAMADVTEHAQGRANPYRRRYAVFQTGSDIGSPVRPPKAASAELGVTVAKVEHDRSAFNLKYDPGHKNAIHSGPNKGYVRYPNVDMTLEYVDAMEATRAYEANVAVFQLSKAMISSSLGILA